MVARRILGAALLALAALLVFVVVKGVGVGVETAASPPRRVASVARTTAYRVGAITTPHGRYVARSAAARSRQPVSPGSLPQTHAYPSGKDQRFKALMAALWDGIVRDSTAAALPAFFPRGAYVQLKQIPSAGSDWQERLVHDYSLDIHAAHSLLGHDAAPAQLIAVDVNSSYGHWIPPDVCYNSIGYYEMPNARVVYRQHGAVRSFGIASMISWRGVWYVVHLGAILRAAVTGEVDEPSAGRGVSAYSGTC